MANVDSLVRDFHIAMNIPVATELGIPSDERVRLRARLIAEEFVETMRALFDHNPANGNYLDEVERFLGYVTGSAPIDVNLVELADGLCDLDYVVAGTRLEFGIPGEEVLEEVHRSNCTKIGAPKRDDGKIMKGENFSPPDIAGVLVRHGFRE